MRVFTFAPFFALCSIFGALLSACTIEHAEEQVLARHVNGIKKTSVWVYPDGEILKRNEWYNDGIKEFEIPYKNGEPHGDFKRWTGFGDVVLTGTYKKGKRHGKWTGFYSDKKVESYRYYKDDHPVGDWEGWHYNRNKAFEEHFDDNGDTVGVWKKWFANGNLAEEKTCFGNNANGYTKTFLENGRKDVFTDCKNGKRDGTVTVFIDNGANTVKEKSHYKQGILDGTREVFNADGKVVKREFWSNGSREGTWEWFDNDGQKIAEETFESGNGKAHGLDDFGKFCAETTFVAGVPTQLWYYRAGHSLRYEETWRDGEIAESRSFYPDSMGGRMASEGFWQRNLDGSKRHGIWRNWYPSGILRDSLTYVNGERVGEQFSYDSTGKLTIHKTEAGKNRPVIMHKLWEE